MKTNFTKSQQYLVAMREDGKFLALEETFATTSEHYVDNPIDAKRIQCNGIPEEVKIVTYYFETSYRAKRWLENCKMVLVTLESSAAVAELPGPGYLRDPEAVADRADIAEINQEMDAKGIEGMDRLSYGLNAQILRRVMRVSPYSLKP